MKTFLKILRVITDLVIVFGAIVFVDSVIDYGSDAAAGAGLIVFSFVVKGWINRYSKKDSEEAADDAASLKQSSSSSTVMSVVGIVLITSIALGALDEADDARAEAQDATRQVEDLEHRVDDLEY
jgi:hypothetical protein